MSRAGAWAATCVLLLAAAGGGWGRGSPAEVNTVMAPGARDDAARQPWLELLSWKPRAYLFHRFLSDEECDHIISTPHIKRSSVVNPDGSIGDDPIRTSWGTFLQRGQDEVVYAIEHRIANWTHLPVGFAEDMQVLRYSNNQTYGAHWDDLDLDEPGGAEGLAGSGSVRVATVLIYLSDAEYGGETAFPRGRWLDAEKQAAGQPFSDCAKEGVAALPRKGNAVMFWDTKIGSMRQDKWSLHTGCPVLRGVKWTAVKWIHAKPFGGTYPERPLATSGESLAAAEALLQAKQDLGEIPREDCYDENNSCRMWAKEGQCTKNAKFMRQACRLTCGECCLAGDVLCERQRLRAIHLQTH